MAYPPGAASSAAGFGMLSTAAGAASAAAGAASSAASAAAAAARERLPGIFSSFSSALEAFRDVTGWVVSRATIAGTTLAAWLVKPHMDTCQEYVGKLKAARHHQPRFVYTVMRDETYNVFHSLAAEMVSLSEEARRAMIHMLICLINYETIYKNANNTDPSNKTTDAQIETQAILTLDAILIYLHLAREKTDRKVTLIRGLGARGWVVPESNASSQTVNELGTPLLFPPHLADAINAFLQMYEEKLGSEGDKYPIHIGRAGGAAASTLPYLREGTEKQTEKLYEKALERIRALFAQCISVPSSELLRRIYGPTDDEGASVLAEEATPAPAAAAAGPELFTNIPDPAAEAAPAPAAAAAGTGLFPPESGRPVNGTAPKRRITHYFHPPPSSGSKRKLSAIPSASDSNADPNAAQREKRPRGGEGEGKREGEGEGGEGQTGGSRRTRRHKHKRNHRSRLRSRTHKRRVTKSKHKSNRKTKTNRRH